jgi:hypothetical protein
MAPFSKILSSRRSCLLEPFGRIWTSCHLEVIIALFYVRSINTELSSSDKIRTIAAEDVNNAKIDLGIAVTPTFNSRILGKFRRFVHAEYVISGTYMAMGNQPTDNIRVDVHLQDANCQRQDATGPL